MRLVTASVTRAIVASFLLCSAVHARDSQCDLAPYGDTADNYTGFVAIFAPVMKERAFSILQDVCRAKFYGERRSVFYGLGLTDYDFDVTSPTGLATQVIAVMRFIHSTETKPNSK